VSESPRSCAPDAIDAPADPWAPEQVIDDRFQIVRELGRGAMGAAHVVFDRELCREVALKRMLPAGIGVMECEERFRREFRALAAIAHPGVPQVHHSGRAPDGSPWFTMEIVRGESLRVILDRDRLAPARALKLAIELGRVLAAAHEAGVIHRDVKPGNVMIEPGDRVRLLDFGVCTPMPRFLARAEPRRRTAVLDRWQTQDADFAGTFGYSDPATFDGSPATARSDIFSVAAILYEMVSGRRLFDPDGSLYRTIDSAEFPTSLASLASVLRRAAAHHPFERPRTMPEFIQSLEIAHGHLLRAESEARAPHLRVLLTLLGVTLGVLLTVAVGRLATTDVEERASTEPAAPAPPIAMVLNADARADGSESDKNAISAPGDLLRLEPDDPLASSRPARMGPARPPTPRRPSPRRRRPSPRRPSRRSPKDRPPTRPRRCTPMPDRGRVAGCASAASRRSASAPACSAS